MCFVPLGIIIVLFSITLFRALNSVRLLARARGLLPPTYFSWAVYSDAKHVKNKPGSKTPAILLLYLKG